MFQEDSFFVSYIKGHSEFQNPSLPCEKERKGEGGVERPHAVPHIRKGACHAPLMKGPQELPPFF